MLQVFSNNTSEIILDEITPQSNIDMLNEHIKLFNCKNMTVDISSMNIMDACMVSALCSAEHYIKYPDGKLNWIVNSKAVEEYLSPMNLGNSRFIYR